MNPQQVLKNEHFIDSNSIFDELIDYIGDLLAEEYYQLMEGESQNQNDVNGLSDY